MDKKVAFDFPFDVGYLLIGTVIISFVWGMACCIIGGILRFDLAQYVNEYIKDVDGKKYTETSKGMITVPAEFDEVNLGNWTVLLGAIAICLGVIVVLYSVIGGVGGLLKHTTLLFILIGLVLMAIMLQFVVMWMVFDSDNTFHQTTKDDLVAKLQKEYTLGKGANTFSKVMNALMIAGECCGINGWSDFDNKNMSFTAPTGETFFFTASPACCKKAHWNLVARSQSFEVFTECLGDEGRYKRNVKGCYDILYNAALDSTMGTIFICLILIMIWELLVIGASIIVLFWHEEEHIPPPEPEPEPEPEPSEEEIPEPIPFTPFSQISSFVASDIERLKSTEIW